MQFRMEEKRDDDEEPEEDYLDAKTDEDEVRGQLEDGGRFRSEKATACLLVSVAQEEEM